MHGKMAGYFVALISHLWHFVAMKWEKVLETVKDEPVFDTGLLLSGDVNPVDVRRQLSRWVRSGKLYQLRRGLYALAPPFQKFKPHPLLVANRLVPGSYVSAQAALAHWGLIPEHVPVVTSVTLGRPTRRETPLGAFEYRHLKRVLFVGYRLVELPHDQKAFVAGPEKALLDLVHLTPGADSADYLAELRLQNLEQLALNELERLAAAAERPKLLRALEPIRELARRERAEYETL
jgi:predicted transcriptional regulator of viral defense system